MTKNIQTPDPFSHLPSTLQALQAKGLHRSLLPISARTGPFVHHHGQTLLNFASNDYLGLSQNSRLCSLFASAVADHGLGAASSRLISGTFDPHLHFERVFASFKQTEASLLFPSGYQTNISAITSFADPQTLIYSDERNHASIVDACRLTRASCRIYRHLDMNHLSSLLKNDSSLPNKKRIVVSDTVFSTDGATAPLTELADLADRHHALLIVDEAHATGVLGPRGRGLAAESGVKPHLHVATLSKALGLSGGVIATSALIRDAIINFGRSFIYTTAPPPALAVTAAGAIELISGPEGNRLRARLSKNVSDLLSGLRAAGWQVDSQSHIIALRLDHPKLATAASQWLRQRGLLALALRPPTVPPGNSLLRLSPTSLHQRAHIRQAIDLFSELHTKLPEIQARAQTSTP